MTNKAFLDKNNIPIDLDLEEAILKLKKERNAVILSHFYVDSEIQELADVLGDSLALAQAAKKTDADVIVFCGVHFMAETAKALNPEKIVVLPDLEAGCSLADSCRPEDLKAWKDNHPEHKVVFYINCNAETKALSDMICTSSNAEKIINSFPEDQPILFGPDKNLGAYLNKKLGRNMDLWPGSCLVHETFSERKIVALKAQNLGAEFIAHPECEEAVLAHADFIGSTTALLNYVQTCEAKTLIVGTETGILHQMKKMAPDKRLIPVPFDDENTCGCNECPHMKLNSLEKLYLCLRDLEPRIEMTKELQAAVLKPLDRMLSLS
jgi:quinolinate synthase